MDVRKTPVWTAVNEIMSNGPNEAVQSWACEFLIEGLVHKPYQLIGFDIDRDTSKKMSDYIIIEVALDQAIYLNYVVPNKNNITVTLYKKPRTEMGDALVGKIYSETFSAYVIGGTDPMMTPKINMGSSDEALSTAGFNTYHFQLVAKAAEQVRAFECEGIYHGQSPGDLLRDLFTRYSSQAKLGPDQAIPGVEMIPPDNKQKMQNMYIPPGISLLDLPEYLQNEVGGIYNAGIDFFLHANTWFIWPKYGLDRHNTNKRVLTVFALPESQLPGAERTFINDPGQVRIIATGGGSLADATESIALNQGNGVRYVDAMSLIGDGIQVSGNKMIARRGVNANEFVDNKRPNGVNIARMAESVVTSNPMKYASQLSASKGVVVTVGWENADPNILYPGMPVKYIVMRGSEMVERRGILVAEQYKVEPANRRMKASFHRCTAGLTLFLSREDYSRVEMSLK